jgi:hypothetical protein
MKNEAGSTFLQLIQLQMVVSGIETSQRKIYIVKAKDPVLLNYF